MAEKPIEYTNLIAKLEAGKDYLIFYDGDSGYTLGIVHYHKSFKDTIELIQAAVNACISINKEKPMAVAEGMEEQVKLFKELVLICEFLVEEHPQMLGEIMPKARKVDAEIRGVNQARITGGK